LEALADEFEDGRSLINMEVVAGALDLCDACIGELVCKGLVVVAHREGPVQEEGQAWVGGVLAAWVPYDRV